MDQSFIRFQEEITKYIFLEDDPKKADVIFVPGNGYPQMAERAAKLWKDGYAPYVLPSGKYSTVLNSFAGVQEKGDVYTENYQNEWEFLSDVLRKNGVPKDAVLKENRATFTYENAIYSRQVTDQMGLIVKRAILCCKSQHARRCQMYYQTLYPETEILLCPCNVGGISRENWQQTKEGIEEVLGEVLRIVEQFNLMMKGFE